jgi:hypothetical protein
MLEVGELGDGVDERAAAEEVLSRQVAQPGKDSQDLLPGRQARVVAGAEVPPDDLLAPRVKGVGDELLLAAELLVQRPLGHARRLAHQVNPDRADAVAVEQVGGGVNKPLAGRRAGHVCHGREAYVLALASGKPIGILSSG